MSLVLSNPTSIEELCKLVNAQLAGSFNNIETSNKILNTISGIENAGPNAISFLANSIYKKYLSSTKAGVVILSEDDQKQCAVPAIVVKDPRFALYKILQLCQGAKPNIANIAHNAVIDKSVKLGVNAKIAAGVVIAEGCSIGDNVVIHPNVTIHRNVKIGNNCVLHSGCVIGSDGFGFALDEKRNWLKMPHLGSVLIADNVSIGANTCVDRGLIDNTIIANNVIIDNLVQIGHNVEIGDNTAIAGCTAIGGSTTIGKNCLIGGATNITGHIYIVDNVQITGGSSISSRINNPGMYSSSLSVKESSVWRKIVARFAFLEDMAKRIKKLEKELKNIVNLEQV